MKNLLLILFLICCAEVQAQDPYKYVPELIDYPKRNVRVNYRWPYIRNTPAYVGLIGGWEGVKSNYYQMGLALNLVDMYGAPGGVVGTQFLYQRHIAEDVQRYQVELGFYTVLCMGLNFNYTTQNEYGTFGVKPFIGFSAFNIQVLYGFNIYRKKKNEIDVMRNSSFEFRLVIPLITLWKDKDGLVPGVSGYPEGGSGWNNYPSSDIELR